MARMIRHGAAAGLAAAVLALGGCGLTGPAHGPPSPQAASAVEMGFESFDPPAVTIRAGETVEWRNTSLIAHTVTDDPARAGHASDAGLPPGAAPFDSGRIAAGEVFLRRFDQPGTYRYFCRYHEMDGMTGTVVVLPRG